MADQENLEKRNEEVVVDNTDYIAAIEELKKNSVSKDQYDALAARERKLLEAVVNGQEISTSKQEPALEPRLEYYKRYKENKFTNDLDYWTNMVNLRKATIKEYGADPCVTGNFGLTPEGSRIEPAYGESETVEEQFGLIEEMIKEANGNPLVFETLMQSSLPRK